MNWDQLEAEVRSIAEAKWSQPCKSELIEGVQIDGVVRVRPDYIVLIEVSKSGTLEKLRTDLAKFAVLKPALMAKGIYAECHFVTLGDGNPSLVQIARSANVEPHTLESFSNTYLATNQYVNERSKLPFGSAVVPESGSPDNSDYTPISYIDQKNNTYTINDICKALKNNSKIVLIGEFGTGKSRCLKETFHSLVEKNELFAPLAINLRDNWGQKKMSGIVRGHLEDLGLDHVSNSVLKSVRSGNHTILLDGFDEIGSQSWSGESSRLEQIRRASLAGVRDVIENLSGAGLLITGREHYFSSEEEMLSCLGLQQKKCIILRCPEEFSEDEARSYLSRETKDAILPDWLPRKPLVCQLLSKLGLDELKSLENAAIGEVDFFEKMLDAVCLRETRIHSTLDKENTKRILLNLAQESRLQSEEKESLTPEQINKAFFEVTGTSPIDESAILLQRLPYLGRVGSGGTERIFIDDYVKNGLRGIAAGDSLRTSSEKTCSQQWKQELSEFGIQVLSHVLPNSVDILKYIRKCVDYGNSQIAADFVSASIIKNLKCDFKNLTIDGASIRSLNFTGTAVQNLTLLNVFINSLTIDDAKFDNVHINDCLIDVVDGCSARDELPDIFGKDCVVSDYRHGLTTTSISGLNLSDGQKTLLALVKKLFFQPGSGRKEEALLRGADSYWEAKTANQIIVFMLSNDIITKHKGNSGWVYSPKRKHMSRMNLIVELQKSSTDELWNLVR